MNGEYIRKSSMDRLVAAMASFNDVTEYPIKHADDATLNNPCWPMFQSAWSRSLR